MNREERAAQIWPLLVLAAKNHQTLTYDLLSHLIGVPRQGLGAFLDPIQTYCIGRDYPALTSLVVSEVTGIPGEGFIADADVPRAQADVYKYKWLELGVPSPDDF